MNDAINDNIDTLREAIAKQARDPEEAQLIALKALGKLAGTNWQPYFEQLGRGSLTSCLGTVHEVEQRLNEMVKAAIEAQLNQLKAQPAQETAKKAAKKSAKRPIPKNLPPGTMFARDFWSTYGVSHGRYRQHVERGVNGDFPETTERIPYPDTRPNYKERFVTPDNRSAIFAFWDRHEVDYTAPESDEEASQ